MAGIGSMQCCGVKDYHGLNASYMTPSKILRHIKDCYPWRTKTTYGDIKPKVTRVRSISPAFIVFTEAQLTAPNDRMERLKRLVDRMKYGTFTISEWRLNENTGNQVRVGVFTPDYTKWHLDPQRTK